MSYAPFMGDNKPLSVGLNPLGIRTASEQLFTTLLPGLNVVTLEFVTIASIVGFSNHSMPNGQRLKKQTFNDT